MADKILKKSDMAEFVASFGEREVLGPVRQDGKIVFGPGKGPEFVFDYSNSHMSPKEIFFPQSENMFVFTTDESSEQAHILQEIPDAIKPKVVFGVRPCDAKAFAVLDQIFKNDQYTDTFWEARRDATVLIGLGCNEPCSTCFCTSVNAGPFHEEGLDVLAFDLGDELLLRPLTDKGEALLKDAQALGEPSGKVGERAAANQAIATEAIKTHVNTDQVFKRTVMELFDADHWNRVFESCLNCGTCTYVCPTCHCFDIQDEVDGSNGVRMRNWDSCMSWLFTMHGTGHNPRPGKMERVRQRFMHKFKYIPMKRNGEIGCVGCGRCITLCPVNIDVRDVVRDMNA